MAKATTGLRLGRRGALKLATGAAIAAAGPAQAADITLSVWTGYPELVPWYKQAGEAYTKANPATKVTVFSTTLREHEQKLAAAMPTGTGPDLFDVGQILSISFIEAGLLKPNTPEVDKQLRGGAYRDVSVGQFTTEGKTYGLPLMFSTPMLFWNKTMFREAGLSDAPGDFQQAMEYAKKLTKIDATGKMTRSGLSLRLSGQGSGIAEKFRFILEPAGGALIVRTPSGKWHQGYDNAAGQAALKYYIDAVQTQKVDDPKVQHDADAFVAGNTAMLMRESWVIGEIRSKNPTLDFGVSPIPAWMPGGVRKTLLQHNGMYVSGKSRNPAAANDFIQFLTNKENSVKLTQLSGWVSARSDVDWAPLLKEIPQYEAFVSPPKDVQFYLEPVLSSWNEIETKLADQLPGAYVDPSLKDNPQKLAELVKKWAAQTDSLLKEAGLYGTN
jgi:multiple sugar transport system substrate-binding protein